MNDKLAVTKIQNGVMVDHIPPGMAFLVLKILRISSGYPHTVTIQINAQSKKTPSQRKDFVKIWNAGLSENDINRLGLIIPGATLNIIENYEVIEKKLIQTPKLIHGTLKCPAASCITQDDEPLQNEFEVIQQNPIKLRCLYCDKIFKIKPELLIQKYEKSENS